MKGDENIRKNGAVFRNGAVFSREMPRKMQVKFENMQKFADSRKNIGEILLKMKELCARIANIVLHTERSPGHDLE